MTYRTSVSDPFARMMAFLIVAFAGMVLVFSLIGLYSVWLVLPVYIIFMCFVSFYVMKVASAAIIETEVLADRLSVRWISSYPLKKCTDREIRLSDIEEHSFVTSKYSKVFTLLLKDGSEFAYNQFNWYVVNREDMETMGKDIWAAVEQYNTLHPPAESGIPLGYEKQAAIPEPTPEEKRAATLRIITTVIAVIGIYLFIGFPVLKMILPARSLMWEFKMLAGFTGMLLLFAKVFGAIYEKWQKAKEAGDAEESNTGY